MSLFSWRGLYYETIKDFYLIIVFCSGINTKTSRENLVRLIGVLEGTSVNEHWISRSFLLLQIVISRYNCSLLFPLYLFFESSHLSCFALMSADSVCLCCSREDSFRISDLFTVVGVQNATALRLCTEASPPLLCAQSYTLSL